MSKALHIDFAVINEYVSYLPDEGVFIWKKHKYKSWIGRVAGFVKGNGYLVLQFNKRTYLASRVAWVLMNGTIDPLLQIDHIDKVKLNNKYKNLRLVTASENQRNKPYKNLPRPKNYSWSKSAKKFKVGFHGKHIGYFLTEKEAVERVAQLYAEYERTML